METNEAAAALLNMESPNNILDEKRMSKPSLVGSNSSLGWLALTRRRSALLIFLRSSYLWHSAGV